MDSVTLHFDEESCINCGMCESIIPGLRDRFDTLDMYDVHTESKVMRAIMACDFGALWLEGGGNGTRL